MINSRKLITLCATTLTGLTILSSVAPISAFADEAEKSGETAVKYAVPAPADWAISVPSEISVEKLGNVDGKAGAYGVGEVKIVKADGSDRESGDVDENAEYQLNTTYSGEGKLGTKPLHVLIGAQGVKATDWDSVTESIYSGEVDPKAPFNVMFESDGTPLTADMIFGVKDDDAGTVKAGDSMKISWTASRMV